MLQVPGYIALHCLRSLLNFWLLSHQITSDVNEARSIWDRGHKVEAKAEAEAKCYEAEAKVD